MQTIRTTPDPLQAASVEAQVTGSPSVAAEVRPEADTVVILRNPKSGAYQRRRAIWRLLQALKVAGLKPRLFRHRAMLARWMSRPRLRSRLKCLVAAGGDGTVDALISSYPGIPLAVLPLGTENRLAKLFRIPRDGARLAQLIHAGHSVDLDVGQIGPRRFLLMLSAGYDATVIHEVHRHRHGNLTHLSYCVPGLRHSLRRSWPMLRVTVDSGETIECEHAWLFNLPTYALSIPLAEGADGRDGRLDLRAICQTGLFGLWQHLWRALRHRFPQGPGVVCRQGRKFRIDADVPVPLQIDGDPAGTTPVDVEIVPRGVQLLVPATMLPTRPRTNAAT